MSITKLNILAKIIVSFLIAILIVTTIIAIIIFSFFYSKSPCFMDDGPYYGQKEEVNLDTITIDKTIDLPNGKLIFSNTQDSLSPLLIKLNQQDKIIWSYRLDTGEKVNPENMPLYEMQSIRFNGTTIDFFNESHLEPGSIHLDRNYNFKCICLSVF